MYQRQGKYESGNPIELLCTYGHIYPTNSNKKQPIINKSHSWVALTFFPFKNEISKYFSFKTIIFRRFDQINSSVYG